MNNVISLKQPQMGLIRMLLCSIEEIRFTFRIWPTDPNPGINFKNETFNVIPDVMPHLPHLPQC